MRPVVAVCIVAVLATNTLRGQPQFSIERPSRDVVVFNIGGTKYGSLEFDGAIERADMGTEWEFRIRLFATFHANTKPNQTDSVNLAMLRFVGTNPRTDGVRGPATVLAEHREPIDLHLDLDGERKPLPEVAFRVTKEPFTSAAFVGIAVIEARGLMWPIPVPVRLTETF